MDNERAARLAVVRVRRALATHLRKPNRPADGPLAKNLAAIAPEFREEALRRCVALLQESAAKEPERDWVFSLAALSVARRFLAEGLPVPEALPLLIDATTFDLHPWQPAFASLERSAAARVYAVLSKRLPTNTLPQLSTLRGGTRTPKQLIAELEDQIRCVETVDAFGRVAAPLGRLGGLMIEPLRARIDERLAAVVADPRDGSSRRILLGLRLALAVAIAETLEDDGEVDPDFQPYLALEPPELFADHPDSAYAFLFGLPASLFARAPEAWVLRWLAAWRGSAFHRAEQDKIVKGLLPSPRKRLFFL